VTEWPIVPVSKTGVPERAPRVRIPPSPLEQATSPWKNKGLWPCSLAIASDHAGSRIEDEIPFWGSQKGMQKGTDWPGLGVVKEPGRINSPRICQARFAIDRSADVQNTEREARRSAAAVAVSALGA
jgi:hypothetical protein